MMILAQLVLTAIALAPDPALAAPVTDSGVESADIDALAREIAGTGRGTARRAQRLVTWINSEFEWTATDYERRSADQIIARKAGNCAELSRVLARLLDPAGIRYRWVAEINIQPASAERERNAQSLIAERGNRASVFGLRHNDHRWLEVLDDESGNWIPADPSVGTVGMRPWIRLRMALGDRPDPAVPAVRPILQDMIVPIAVLARSDDDERAGNLSERYLVREFNAAYGGALALLPSWPAWVQGVGELSARAELAFEGAANLHDHGDQLAELAAVYQALRSEARACGLALIE
jgi:hypothetical protein